MVLDYLSTNALNKYPFEDNASIISQEGPRLTDDTFLDILAASKQADIVRAYLYTFVVNTGPANITLQFKFVDDTNTVVHTATVIIPFASIIEKQFYAFSNSTVAIKVVFGANFVALTTGGDQTMTFTETTGMLEQSAVVIMVPRVTTLSFFNWDKNTNESEVSALASFTGSELIEMTVTLEEGANVSLVQNDNGAAVDVLAGSGTGLYDGCSADLVIRTINDVGPDTNQQFLLNADDCYTETQQTHGITLANHCTPKCSTAMLAAFAHYENRIADGMTTIFDYAGVTYEAVRDEINRYATDVNPYKNQPYFKVVKSQFPTIDTDIFYYSFAAGYFNPTKNPISLDFSMASTGSTKLLHYKVGADNTDLDGDSFSIEIPCLSACFVDIIISATDGGSLSIMGSLGGISINYEATLT